MSQSKTRYKLFWIKEYCALSNGSGRVSYLIAVAIGAFVVLTIFPHNALISIPDANLSGDAAQHVAGQRAFIEDAWRWPLLNTTLLDWPVGVNIAMTDSIPLEALPLKLFRWMLPHGFTGLQLWLVLVYLLQPIAAVFALRSSGEERLIPALAIAVFAVSMPTFLDRHYHTALSSHFVILLALASYFRSVRGIRGTLLPVVLVPVSLLIHPYIAFMTGAVIVAAPVTLACNKDYRAPYVAAIALTAICLTALLAAVLDYGASTPSGGFGAISMNLLSPIYPTGSFFLGGGLPKMDATGAQYEGYQYLGLGLLSLLGVCIALGSLRRLIFLGRRHIGLILMSVCLTALALSNVIYAGHVRLIDLEPVPPIFQQIKASGRLFWPVAYLLMIFAVAAIPRLVARRTAYALVLGAASLQATDSVPQFKLVTRSMQIPVGQPTAQSLLLDQLLSREAHLTILPTFGCGADASTPEFMQLLLASTRHAVPTNTMYVARFSRIQSCHDTAAAQAPLAVGEVRVFLPVNAEVGPLTVPNYRTFCRALSTISVCSLRTGMIRALPLPVAPTIVFGTTVSTTTGGQLDVLGPGWYTPESDGAWTVDHSALLAFHADLPKSDVVFEAQITGYTGNPFVTQQVSLIVNGRHAATWSLPDQRLVLVKALIPRSILVNGVQIFRFDVAHPVRPYDVGLNLDTRELGLQLRSFRLVSAAGPKIGV